MPSKRFHVSFEFFPPATERGKTNLMRTAEALGRENPDFFSVTYGAGGSTRTGTKQTVESLLSRGWNGVPHLSWGHSPRSYVIEQVKEYQRLGVTSLVLLRGDIPSGTVATTTHPAADLVKLVREDFNDEFDIYVAAYPEMHPDSPDPTRDIEFLREKIGNGATACFTQYFYNADAYFYFVDQCTRFGIDVPIIPGVMPITNYERLVRFSVNCGAEIPRWIERKMYQYRDQQEALEDFGCEVVSSLCRRLREGGCPGLHFYTLNRARATTRILKSLALP